MIRPLFLLSVSLLAPAALAGPYDPSFTPIAPPAGASPAIQPQAISADGGTVVGDRTTDTSTGRYEAFRRTDAAGVVGLGYMDATVLNSRGTAVSADGSVIVGWGYAGSNTAYRHTASGGMVSLGYLSQGFRDSKAFGVSADGNVVVGGSFSANGFEAFRWTQATGMVGIGDFAGGGFNSRALGISGDGLTIVGTGTSTASSGGDAFRWTGAGGMVAIGDLNTGPRAISATAVNADGKVIVGQGGGNSGPYRWTSGTGAVALGLPGGALNGLANAVSPDGLVVVGQYIPASGGSRALIWDGFNGTRDLTDLMAATGVLPGGFTMTVATGVTVSPVGVPIVTGYGNYAGSTTTQGFVAAVPEPATLAALGFGALALLRRRRR